MIEIYRQEICCNGPRVVGYCYMCPRVPTIGADRRHIMGVHHTQLGGGKLMWLYMCVH